MEKRGSLKWEGQRKTNKRGSRKRNLSLSHVSTIGIDYAWALCILHYPRCHETVLSTPVSMNHLQMEVGQIGENLVVQKSYLGYLWWTKTKPNKQTNKINTSRWDATVPMIQMVQVLKESLWILFPIVCTCSSPSNFESPWDIAPTSSNYLFWKPKFEHSTIKINVFSNDLFLL